MHGFDDVPSHAVAAASVDTLTVHVYCKWKFHSEVDSHLVRTKNMYRQQLMLDEVFDVIHSYTTKYYLIIRTEHAERVANELLKEEEEEKAARRRAPRKKSARKQKKRVSFDEVATVGLDEVATPTPDAELVTVDPTANEEIADDDDACVICISDVRTHAVAPCGHMCLCAVCAQRIVECPLCRGPVVLTMKIFA